MGMEIKMDANLYAVTKQRMARTAAALEKANFTPYCVDTAQQALALIETLVPAEAVVACGGSMSLEQAGVMQLLRSGKYRLMDRARKDITPRKSALCIGMFFRQIAIFFGKRADGRWCACEYGRQFQSRSCAGFWPKGGYPAGGRQ